MKVSNKCHFIRDHFKQIKEKSRASGWVTGRQVGTYFLKVFYDYLKAQKASREMFKICKEWLVQWPSRATKEA
ncbi:hypothetical protein FEM03_10385 [Phragmitibacter flavus]|uniref:Uncharacterized protein n=1 Tax=Phragmitibacter flavus TaxID=2576071 RepID=A0A5R8KEJ5_9BACT|nr:hypothetical protein [Phragmitibacter flavus]TLD70710.1 hypothetical protein FEM03_10385 [Phragmitibacter flavus]